MHEVGFPLYTLHYGWVQAGQCTAVSPGLGLVSSSSSRYSLRCEIELRPPPHRNHIVVTLSLSLSILQPPSPSLPPAVTAGLRCLMEALSQTAQSILASPSGDGAQLSNVRLHLLVQAVVHWDASEAERWRNSRCRQLLLCIHPLLALCTAGSRLCFSRLSTVKPAACSA